MNLENYEGKRIRFELNPQTAFNFIGMMKGKQLKDLGDRFSLDICAEGRFVDVCAYGFSLEEEERRVEALERAIQRRNIRRVER